MTIKQTKCSKCGFSLEVNPYLTIGLGATCIKNARLAYDADIAATHELTGDTMFNFLAIFGNFQDAELPEELKPTLERLSFALINHGVGKILPFEIVLDAFSIARNCSDAIKGEIHKALNELGFKRFINLATGQTCDGVAMLDFDPITGQATLHGTVRRCAAEVFNKKRNKRPHTNFWIFLEIRDLPDIYDTVQLRWPLPNAIVVTQAFLDAVALAKTLPPLPPKPLEVYFRSEDIEIPPPPPQALIHVTNNDKGGYVLDYKYYSPIYGYMLHPSIGGVYRKDLCSTETKVYQVAQEKVEEIEEYLSALFNDPSKRDKKNRFYVKAKK